jgi:Fe-S cluster assembly ATP-binding protein
MNSLLSIKNLSVAIDQKLIINDLFLEIELGKTHIIMGPNGSGKSTLALTLLGHPAYQITAGSITLTTNEKTINLLELATHERAKAGLFLAFQYPYEIEGVIVKDFLRQAYNNIHGGTAKQLGLKAFRELLEQKTKLLGIKPEFLTRSLNVGFSGGEKKIMEMLQLAILQPKLAILDEIDSGLDIDALKAVTNALALLKQELPELTLLIITHYQRILQHLSCDTVHVMQNGSIIKSGTAALALELEQQGYTPHP